MKKYLFILFIFTIILNTSCDKFTKGLIVEIEIPEHEPVLTPYAFINADDSSVTVVLQKSQGALENAETAYIDNATVELYKNGTLWNTIPHNSSITAQNNGIYELSMNNAFSDEGYGDSYELRIDAPDFETTTASQVMPTPVMIEEIDFIEGSGVSQFGQVLNNVKVTFQDPAGEENYYKIQVTTDYYLVEEVSGDTISSSNSFGVGPFTTNPSIESGLNGDVIVNDKLFDGQLYTADLGAFQNISVFGIDTRLKAYLKVTLFSITRDEYLYQKSLATYSASNASLFAEPTLIHSNTSSGLGVFSMMSTNTVEQNFEF